MKRHFDPQRQGNLLCGKSRRNRQGFYTDQPRTTADREKVTCGHCVRLLRKRTHMPESTLPCPGCGQNPGTVKFAEWFRHSDGLYLHFEMFPDGPDWVRCPGGA